MLKITLNIFTALVILMTFGCKSKLVNIEDYNTELLTTWNRMIMDLAIEEDGLLTLKGVRTESMVFIAIHDALNSIDPQYTRYLYRGAHPTANPISATAQAAFEVALKQFPDKKFLLTEELNKWLGKVPDVESKVQGIRLGKAVAREVLISRSTDRYDEDAAYTWHPMAPGVYAEFSEHSATPEGFIFGAGWAAATPFLLKRQDQFRSPPPPAIDSNEYTTAFNEVKEVGSTHSSLRTADQAHLAMWWKDFVENSHNRLARELVVKEDLNLWEAARALALLNMTIYDAYVNVFDNKFHYNHWRPYTAIRWAANDENPNTDPDNDWNNLHRHTYAFPSYPSAHGTASSAAMRVLSNVLGTGDRYSFTMTTEQVDSAGPYSEKVRMEPPTRSFTSFTEAGFEASISRVYLGIHFRYDSEEGHRLGNEIGDFVNRNYLTPSASN